MRLEKRHTQSALALVLAPVGAVAFTMLVSALLVLWAGAPVTQTYGLLLQGGFGSVFALSETFTRAIPLMLTGLAATVAFKARLFNIGAEGQLYAGALAAVAVGGMHGGTGFDQVPLPVLFVLMLLAAALAGALLLLGPARDGVGFWRRSYRPGGAPGSGEHNEGNSSKARAQEGPVFGFCGGRRVKPGCLF